MTMKVFYICFILLFCTSPLFAQEDRFSDINQVKGKDIYVIDNSALSVAYAIVDNKVKPINKIKNLNVSMAGKVYSVDKDEYTYKKNSFVVLKEGNGTILLRPEDSPLLTSAMRHPVRACAC